MDIVCPQMEVILILAAASNRNSRRVSLSTNRGRRRRPRCYHRQGMDTPQTSSYPTPAVPPVVPSHGSNVSSRQNPHALLVGGILALILIAGGWYYLSRGDASNPVPMGESRFEFSGSGVPHWYEVSGASISAVAGPAGFGTLPFDVIEAVESPFSDEHIVLAKVPDAEGIVLGILLEKTRFLPVLSDGSDKSGITVSQDKNVAFSVYSNGSKIRMTNLPGRDHKIIDLGSGRSPHFLKDGFLIALAPEGLVRINPATLARTTLIARSGVEARSAISDDGTLAAIANVGSNTIELYALDEAGNPTLFTVVPGVVPLEAAFIGRTQLILMGAENILSYGIPAKPQPLIVRGAILTAL